MNYNDTLSFNAKLPSEIKTTDNIKKALTISAEFNYPALLIGETGTGKTTAIKALAKANNKDLIRVNLSGSTGQDELLGKWLANEKGLYWQNGEIIRAMLNGSWLVLDEINASLPEVLFILHSLLDDDRQITLKEKNGEVITPHKDFRIFATMNPPAEYAGTKELNKALLSRFPIVLNIEYSTKESDIITNQTGLEKEQADKLVVIAKEIRQAKEVGAISLTASTRDIINAGRLILTGFTMARAVELSLINKANQDDKDALIKLIALLTGEKIAIPTPEQPDRTFKDIDEIKTLVSGLESEIKDTKERYNKIQSEKQAFSSLLRDLYHRVSTELQKEIQEVLDDNY